MGHQEPPPQGTPTSRPPRSIPRGTAPTNIPAAPGPRARLRPIVWTGAIAAITIMGTFYGAGLKTQQEYQAEKKQVLETPVEDRIAGLEQRRETLVSQKMPLERKLAGIRARIKANEIQSEGRNGE
ncbi:hypothetical protein SLS62_003395 [Diatrype stigma]|uniref:Uncharacterized protein n=1 Tax=Diatrype stigma TaxID=117547 RepID=A0AAN9UWM8_9PEZI